MTRRAGTSPAVHLRSKIPVGVPVNVPKTKKTCDKGKEFRKHTLHEVTRYKKGKDSLTAQAMSAKGRGGLSQMQFISLLVGTVGRQKMTLMPKQIVWIWNLLHELYAQPMGQPINIIQKNIDQDYFMPPQETKEFGLIDEAIDQRPMHLVSDAVGIEGEGKEKDRGSSRD